MCSTASMAISAPEIGLDDRRVVGHLFDAALGDQSAFVHHRHIATQTADGGHFMADDEECYALFLIDPLDGFHDHAFNLRVHPGEGFIHEVEEQRTHHEAPSDLQQHALPPGKG